MGSLWIIRNIVLFFSLAFTAIVVGLAINLIVVFTPVDIDGISLKLPSWAIYSVVVGGLSLIFLIPMVTIDLIRRGALTSLIIVDLIVTSVLSVLWLADAALITDQNNLKFLKSFGYSDTCSGLDELIDLVEEAIVSEPAIYGSLADIDFSQISSLCRQKEAIQAMSFLAWLFLMGYAITLLCTALVARNRGNTEIWSSTVRDTRFLEHHEVVNVSIEHSEELPVGKQY